MDAPPRLGREATLNAVRRSIVARQPRQIEHVARQVMEYPVLFVLDPDDWTIVLKVSTGRSRAPQWTVALFSASSRLSMFHRRELQLTSFFRPFSHASSIG